MVDLFFVFSLVLIAIPIAISFRLHFLFTTFLFFGLPSVYLLWRKPAIFKKAAAAAALLGLVWGFSFDYVAEFNHAWGWSTNTALTFPIQFFGVVSLDIMVWYFLWVFLIVAFYEYFADPHFSSRISPHAKWAVVVGLIVACIVVALSKIAPALLIFNYAYLALGIGTLVPFGLITLRNPRILPKVLEIVPFFICVYLSFELTALYLKLWSFPGHYIGTVSVFNLWFPLEELIFWVVASSAITAAYHEYYIDDLK